MHLSIPESGLARAAYLQGATTLRSVLDGTRLLERWSHHAARHPRSTLGHLRTLLAVHNVQDLVDLDLPWWTYEAIDVVDDFLGKRTLARVFEYGSGASTLWLARRCASLDSVEHDVAWADVVERLVAADTTLKCRPRIHVREPAPSETPVVPSRHPSGDGLDFTDYVGAINDGGGKFDLVLVDGRAREASLLAALDRVSDTGMILFDDAQRPRYQDAIAEAQTRGWQLTRTRGRAPCQPVARETALLERSAPQ